MPLDQSLYDVINDLRPTWERGAVQGHLGRFGFSGDEVQRSRGHALRRRAGARRAGDAHAVARESARARRADEPSRRRIDRGARGRDRALRRHGVPREPRSRAASRAREPRVGAARPAHHRLRRQLRRVGDGERGARARRERGGVGGAGIAARARAAENARGSEGREEGTRAAPAIARGDRERRRPRSRGARRASRS